MVNKFYIFESKHVKHGYLPKMYLKIQFTVNYILQ